MRRRISRFVTVGAIGFALQLGALTLLTQAVGWPYEPATALAVALAVLHNFWWHERWTWRDRTATGPCLGGRIARYYVTTGATSIAGNLALTAVGVELVGWSPIVAVDRMAVAIEVAAENIARNGVEVSAAVTDLVLQTPAGYKTDFVVAQAQAPIQPNPNPQIQQPIPPAPLVGLLPGTAAPDQARQSRVPTDA